MNLESDRLRFCLRKDINFRRVIKALFWFWACAAVLSLVPTKAHASRQKTPKAETVKGKASSPTVRKFPKPPIHRLLKNDPVQVGNESLEIREHVIHKTGKNETLSGIVNQLKLPSAEKQLWKRSIQAQFGMDPLPRGKLVHLYFSKRVGKPSASVPPQLLAVELDQDDATSLIWERDGQKIFFQRSDRPYDIEMHTASVVVEDSLEEDAPKAGIQAQLVTQLADIFSWDLDLHKDLGSGDTVKILYEKRTRKSRDAKTYLRILAAELINAGQKFTAIYFEKEKGRGGYYDLDGRSLARNFLRFPLEFVSITSPFSESRFHPILRTHRPHTGIDFAAELGTPVRAVGDGLVVQAGWNGFYGRTIDLQHDSRYTSRYAHLHSFADGISSGVEVKKGQVIGYVGSTGRSTGPHLHFELYKDQQYIDPLSVDFPAEDVIEPALQRVFDNQKRSYLFELSTAPQT